MTTPEKPRGWKDVAEYAQGRDGSRSAEYGARADHDRDERERAALAGKPPPADRLRDFDASYDEEWLRHLFAQHGRRPEEAAPINVLLGVAYVLPVGPELDAAIAAHLALKASWAAPLHEAFGRAKDLTRAFVDAATALEAKLPPGSVRLTDFWGGFRDAIDAEARARIARCGECGEAPGTYPTCKRCGRPAPAATEHTS